MVKGVKQMADEQETKDDGKLSFESKDELTSFLMDLQGQIGNMQETIDKLQPVEDEQDDAGDADVADDEDLSDDEIDEIDQLLQG